MTITEETHDRTQLLMLSGRLDGSTCDILGARLEALAAEGKTQVLLDFGGVPYVSSAGLRVLIIGAKRAKAGGGSLSCCQLQPMVRQVFDLSGFAAILPVHADRASALKALG